MVGICLDVGKGCEYLEDLHFVHRYESDSGLSLCNCCHGFSSQQKRILLLAAYVMKLVLCDSVPAGFLLSSSSLVVRSRQHDD